MNLVTEEDFINTYKLRPCADRALKECSSWFPIKTSPLLAEIVASLLTDGFIDIRDTKDGRKYSYLGFFSKSDEELEEFNEKIQAIFGVKGKIREWGVREYGHSKGCIVLNSKVTRIISLCGAIGGRKTDKEYSIPSWVSAGNEKIKKAFLMKSFDCEGAVSSSERNGSEIVYLMYKRKELEENLLSYLEQMGGLLKEYEIETLIYKKEEYYRKNNVEMIGYCLKIRRQKGIVNFSKHFGFGIKRKSAKLKEIAESITLKNHTA